jgi:two-component system cell cycle sensor histidine kinase/response regulator CckA
VRSDAEIQREDQEKHTTQQLEIQRMEMQKTEALGRLTAGMAHDFNNSLAAITGWIRMASEDLETPHPSQEALQQALKATLYANGLTKQLLAFGRQSKPSLQRIRLSQLIEECRQLVAAGLAKDCEVVVDCRVESDEVDADPTQLQQVLVNLVINAADAMRGRGRIELTLEDLSLPVAIGLDAPPGAHALPNGQYLVLKVRDHGPGIPIEVQSRVFDPFFTTKPKGKGTGLGLSVAHGVIARHHGAIGLTSDADGACFHLYLPISRLSPDVALVTLPGGIERGRQLLFVDDDQSVRRAWSALLERKGWQVTRACDGEDAWTQYSKSDRHFDVVLTDQSMPRLDGVGLAQRIRATESPPPVVLMSGHVAEVGAELLNTLFDAVLHKPIDVVELDRVLKGCVSSTYTEGNKVDRLARRDSHTPLSHAFEFGLQATPLIAR